MERPSKAPSRTLTAAHRVWGFAPGVPRLGAQVLELPRPGGRLFWVVEPDEPADERPSGAEVG